MRPSDFDLLQEKPLGSGVLKLRLPYSRSFLLLCPGVCWQARWHHPPGTFTDSEKRKPWSETTGTPALTRVSSAERSQAASLALSGLCVKQEYSTDLVRSWQKLPTHPQRGTKEKLMNGLEKRVKRPKKGCALELRTAESCYRSEPMEQTPRPLSPPVLQSF